MAPDSGDGSSPRMRGTRICPSRATGSRRIIPADAGNTFGQLVIVETWQDHPRGCGEHLSRGKNVYPAIGSSPRMLGTPYLPIPLDIVKGIIPADAGNTWPRQTTGPVIGDHPRGCGEHRLNPSWLSATIGSSPRMRGTLGVWHEVDPEQWIIPADAGNTMRFTGFTRYDLDHPRGCGEHCARRGDCCGCQGSSPRMRGTLLLRVLGDQRRGIIPADAGNTPRSRVGR